MLFDSAVYLVFLMLVVFAYWRMRHTAQNRFLLAASYFFYGWWDWRFLLVMIASTAMDYWIAGAISRSTEPRKRRSLLVVSLAINFSILGFFKYFNFFVDSAEHFAALLGMHSIPHALFSIILPPAISFYTFQEVAYIVDVYYGRVAAATSFVDYGLFISFFPHLIAGPIQRPSHLLPQVQRPRVVDQTRIYDGVMLILSGLFRKCVIADSCGVLANAAFSGRMGSTGIAALIGIYAFAWQIYGDFSGYSDIARGSAQVLGFHFMVNFRQPYLATSLQDFWRRWHISLSTWLRDYLYIPLGGSRHGEAATYRNLFVTMLLGGLWHGANWTFVFWGALHGAGLAVERALGLAKEVVHTALGTWWRRILVFHFVCFGWIFFRAASFGAAWAYLRQFTNWAWRPTYVSALAYLAIFSLPLFAMDLRLESTGDEYLGQSARFRWQIAAAAAAVIAVAIFSQGESSAFIYFQF
ncbi:MAG TPA: MBOAT family protein [Gemmatimonadaceae bacterium]|nr:MBOAT family protein [Gemmatimonadaceae bacterium]